MSLPPPVPEPPAWWSGLLRHPAKLIAALAIVNVTFVSEYPRQGVWSSAVLAAFATLAGVSEYRQSK